MKISNCMAILLLIALQSACSAEDKSSQSGGISADDPAALQIMFDEEDGSEFTKAEKQLITDILVQSEKEVRLLLPTLPKEIEITAVKIDRNIDVVGGVAGRADAPGKILLELSTTFPGGISAAANTALAPFIFHELHHLDRGWTIQENKFGPGIPIAAVNEGLASVFSEEYTGVHFDEVLAYPDEADQWLEEILALPIQADYTEWVSGAHPDGREYIGYRVGRYIVHQAALRSGKGVIELSKLSPDEILTLAQ